MKKSFRKLIKDYLRVSFLQTRDALHLTQEQMAARLLMSTRAYAKVGNRPLLLQPFHRFDFPFPLLYRSPGLSGRLIQASRFFRFFRGLIPFLFLQPFPRCRFFLPLQLYFLYSFLTISFFLLHPLTFNS